MNLLRTLDLLLRALIEAGAIEDAVHFFRSRTRQAEAEAHLAEEQRIASMLARGDRDELESDLNGLLRETGASADVGSLLDTDE